MNKVQQETALKLLNSANFALESIIILADLNKEAKQQLRLLVNQIEKFLQEQK